MARRRADSLLPIEERILESGLALQRGGGDFHGFALAKAMSGREDGKGLTAHGTLYKALGRLADRGLLDDRWEDADVAAAEGRPRRRLYRVTGAGEAAFRVARTQPTVMRPGTAPA
jgi:DNA-binding PadR family transcriptional regulator